MFGPVYTLLQAVDFQMWPRFCGNYRSFTITIRDRMAFILFSSDSNGTAEGFTLTCEQAEAGKYEPRFEKTGLRGFRPGPTQTGLYNYRRWLEA